MQKHQAEPHSTLYTSTDPKSRSKIHVRVKTIQFCSQNIGQKLLDIEFCNDFLDVTPKAQKKGKNY